ncbi:MAG TPA: hypothetical protein VM536_21135, partial [Chloroflexia bacterium]|nr:hypothetical protein [Chloroflexia bacterium]
MQYPKLSDLRHTPRPELVIMPAPLPDVARQAATAHVRHGLVRSLQGFLDRAGCVELEHPAHFALAAHLRRACWSTRTGGIAGLIPGASDALLIDLLERGLLATLHGTLDRAATELQALGVDCDRLKYLRLPVRRLHADAGATVARDVWPGLLPDAESRILAETGEPLLMLAYTPDS